MIIGTLSLAAVALLTGAPEEQPARRADSWAFEVDVVESCCCDPICPCMVGSKPTRDHCRGSRLVEITRGHHGDVVLDGVSFVLTFDLRVWSKLYFAEATSDEQVAATMAVLEKVWGSLLADVLESAKVPLRVKRTESTVAFSVPASRVEIEVMRGAGDRPIRVENLRTFRDYTQYRSTTVAHTAAKEERSFEYSGTNGFTARFRASSEPADR